MKISGYLGFSLIDYPGIPSFVIFTQGCNFKCPFCHNPELISQKKKGQYSEEFILEEIDRRRKLIKGVVITGGEPTLQENLPSFLFKIKKKRLLIKLDTNGSNPKMLIEIIKSNLVDYVAMDFKTSPSKYHKAIGLTENETKKYLKNIFESLKILRENKIKFEIRTTVVPEIVEEEDLIEIRKIIGENTLYFLQPFKNDKTLSYEFKNKNPYPEEMLEKYSATIKSKLR
ncbi:MAG: anaerobic ribonucleoside-triphosphate reductase activating protein [Dictyoglomus thermophilum]|uniref:Anaerobic ribonucleoside-triphosphate reductase activating protein n=1 Tax=Dictyoglomus thermophilum TaxID=14 RepID=A0A7C2CR59_DICTH|nr:anaerobic ribonucleoside-triphosphate reductase activating protein [Dictyoglomus thermophilum]MCX7720458.1 anaerobic ribonucleoside-triphosphate reductase activating protein [Dictyoglomus thermophilum]TYT24406.1 anaerobic ribonucleoside-triphosphate reductase activating protein [Dictyoglomus thermophilum]